MSEFVMYEVGGCVRDSLLGIRTKDIDYVVIADQERYPTATAAYDAFVTHLRVSGFAVFLSQEEFLTARARFPKGHQHERITADFVLARKEADYFDGRRPSSVAIGTLEDDLRRRDFTVNALARGEDGEIIDLFGGQADLERKILRCVGSPRDRFTEDALRALRALRFRITKDLQWSDSIRGALMSDWLSPLLASVSTERIREELIRCFRFDTLLTLDILHYEVSTDFRDACFVGGLWLKPSLED